MWDKQRIFFYLALFATLLTLLVIILGAYTRLTDAGLGCPDWPGCYGQLTVPKNSNIPNHSIDTQKAWTEMIHRYIAGLLGIVILVLAIFSIFNRYSRNQPLVLPLILTIIVGLQALLGMWTVTLKLFPLVVMAHLLGGMTTLALLAWLTLRFNNFQLNLKNLTPPVLIGLRTGAFISLIVLIVQISLGGWTSANYTALVCPDFPLCHQKLIPSLDFSEAFNLTSAGVTGSIGKPLSLTARITIQMMHRVGAVITTLVIGGLVFFVFMHTRSNPLKILSIITLGLLLLQIILGITNVVAFLPLTIAILHNAVAALLLLVLVTFNYCLYLKNNTS